MDLTSSAFENNGKIPSLYTCDGKNINPPLEIRNVPPAARSLVLIMDDPDVPSSVRKDNMWVHWVIFNIPPDTRAIKENSTPPGTVGQGTGGKNKYEGPCPPDREHRYYFKLYALKEILDLQSGATKSDVEQAMKEYIIEQTQLMARYNRVDK
jgi:Raf kinase inhibitor-like YbhB/YbcL family protein